MRAFDDPRRRSCSSQSTIGNRQSAISQGAQTFFSEFKGAEDGACLVLALFVFAGGDRIGYDAGAGLQVGR